MYQYVAAEQTNIVKLPTFFSRFESEERVLRVKKGNILKKFNAYHFGIEGNHGSINTKKVCLWYFRRFMTSALTLRPRNTDMYIFRVLFAFTNFWSLLVAFPSWDEAHSLLHSIFSKQNEIFGIYMNQYAAVQRNYQHFFQDVKAKSAF